MNTKILLILIIILAVLTRVLFLGQFPNGFTGDEAQQGYSAYSILKTGRDEWGKLLPIFPRGFGDFKPPLYTYLAIPSIAVFGLTIEAVRLPAALVGILAVMVLYFLTKELFKDQKIAILSSFLLAINPWHIQLSRTAFEGGLGVLTFSLGLLFFLKSRRKDLIIAAICWGLTLYTYHSWRVFTVMFILGLVLLFRKNLLTIKNLVVGVCLAIFVIPLLFNINSIMARSSDVGIIGAKQLEGYFAEKSVTPLPPMIDRALDNKVFFIGKQFFENYLSYFSPAFYFTNNRPDNTYLNFPNFSLLFSFEIMFWIAALYMLITKKVQNKSIILLWFFLSTIPAALATGGMNANRATTLLPLTAIISGYCAKIILDKMNSLKFKILKPGLIFIGVFSFLMFLHFYFINLPNTPPMNLRYGYDSVFKKILEVEEEYDHIIISKSFTEGQIFIAFYSQMDPKTFQASSKNWLRYVDAGKQYVDQLESWNLGKYLFEGVDWKVKDHARENALIVSEAKDFPETETSILDVRDPKKRLLYRLVPTNGI